MIGAKLDPITAPGATNNWAGAGSLEMDIFKGFTIKPTLTYARYFGGNCGTNNLGTYAYGGYQPNQCNTATNCLAGTTPSSPGRR